MKEYSNGLLVLGTMLGVAIAYQMIGYAVAFDVGLSVIQAVGSGVLIGIIAFIVTRGAR